MAVGDLLTGGVSTGNTPGESLANLNAALAPKTNCPPGFTFVI